MRVGDKVYLITKRYGISLYNPVKGSIYEKIGIIIETDHETMPFVVRWGPGNTNYYHSEKDFQLAEDPILSVLDDI